MSGKGTARSPPPRTNSLGCHLRHLNTDSQLMDELSTKRSPAKPPAWCETDTEPTLMHQREAWTCN